MSFRIYRLFTPPSLDEAHVSLENTRKVSVVDVESSIPTADEIYVQEDNQNSQETKI